MYVAHFCHFLTAVYNWSGVDNKHSFILFLLSLHRIRWFAKHSVTLTKYTVESRWYEFHGVRKKFLSEISYPKRPKIGKQTDWKCMRTDMFTADGIYLRLHVHNSQLEVRTARMATVASVMCGLHAQAHSSLCVQSSIGDVWTALTAPGCSRDLRVCVIHSGTRVLGTSKILHCAQCTPAGKFYEFISAVSVSSKFYCICNVKGHLTGIFCHLL